MRPLRITLLTPLYELGTSSKSGIAKHYRYLADALAAQGYHVEVVFIPDFYIAAPPAGTTVHAGVIAHCRPVLLPAFLQRFLSARKNVGKLIHALAGIATAYVLLLRQDPPPDIIETTSFNSLGLALLGHPRSDRLVTRVSTTTEQLALGFQTHQSRANELVVALERSAIFTAQHRLTHTSGHARILAAGLGLDPHSFALVPHGIPDRAALPPPTGSAWAGPTVLFAGQFSHRKAIDVVLAAAPRLLTARPDARLVLAGGAPADEAIARSLQTLTAQYGPRLIHLPQPDDDTLHAWMSIATLFTAPSRYESFGLIYLEAMRVGRPIVASQAGGIPDVIQAGVTGLLVPPGDADALAEAWLQCLNHPDEAARLGAAGLARFHAEYTAEVMATRSVALYRDILARTSTVI